MRTTAAGEEWCNIVKSRIFMCSPVSAVCKRHLSPAAVFDRSEGTLGGAAAQDMAAAAFAGNAFAATPRRWSHDVCLLLYDVRKSHAQVVKQKAGAASVAANLPLFSTSSVSERANLPEHLRFALATSFAR